MSTGKNSIFFSIINNGKQKKIVYTAIVYVSYLKEYNLIVRNNQNRFCFFVYHADKKIFPDSTFI